MNETTKEYIVIKYASTQLAHTGYINVINEEGSLYLIHWN